MLTNHARARFIPFAQPWLATALVFMMVMASGCDTAELASLLSEQEEATEEEANNPATPDWAVFDLRTTSDFELTEPWLVFVPDPAASDAPTYQVGQITPTGIFTFDVTSEPPAEMLAPFDVAWFPSFLEAETREDGLSFSNAKPNVLVHPLFNLAARPQSVEAFSSEAFVEIDYPQNDEVYAVVVYSDRATNVSGTYFLRQSHIDSTYIFDLQLNEGYTRVKVYTDGTSINFTTDLGTTELRWIFSESGPPMPMTE